MVMNGLDMLMIVLALTICPIMALIPCHIAARFSSEEAFRRKKANFVIIGFFILLVLLGILVAIWYCAKKQLGF